MTTGVLTQSSGPIQPVGKRKCSRLSLNWRRCASVSRHGKWEYDRKMSEKCNATQRVIPSKERWWGGSSGVMSFYPALTPLTHYPESIKTFNFPAQDTAAATSNYRTEQWRQAAVMDCMVTLWKHLVTNRLLDAISHTGGGNGTATGSWLNGLRPLSVL